MPCYADGEECAQLTGEPMDFSPGVHLCARPEGQRLDSADHGRRIVFRHEKAILWVPSLPEKIFSKRAL